MHHRWCGGRCGRRHRRDRACPWRRLYPKASCPRTTKLSSRSTCACPKGPAWRRPSLAAERIAREVRAWPEVTTTAVDHRRQPPKRPPTWPRSSCGWCPPTSASSRRTSCRTGSARRSFRGSPKATASSALAVSAFSRRQLQLGHGPVHHDRTRSARADCTTRRSHQQAERDPGRRRRRHLAGDRQSGARGGGRIGARRPISACNVIDVAQRCSASRRRRQGLALRGKRQRVRHPRARRRLPSAPARNRLACSACRRRKLGAVPLLDVVSLKRAEGPSQIDRYARQRAGHLLANTAPGVGARRGRYGARESGQGLHLPPAVRLRAASASRRRSAGPARQLRSRVRACRSSSCT